MGEWYTGLPTLCPLRSSRNPHHPVQVAVHVVYARVVQGAPVWALPLDIRLISSKTSGLAAASMLCRLLVPLPGMTCLGCPCHRLCHALQVHFINKSATRLGPAAAYAHGAHMVLLDGIGLGVGMPPQVGACCMPLQTLHPKPCTGTSALVCGLQKGAPCLHMQVPGGRLLGIKRLYLPLGDCTLACLRGGGCLMQDLHPQWGL